MDHKQASSIKELALRVNKGWEVECPDCKGQGYIIRWHVNKCFKCRGTGKIIGKQ